MRKIKKRLENKGVGRKFLLFIFLRDFPKKYKVYKNLIFLELRKNHKSIFLEKVMNKKRSKECMNNKKMRVGLPT